MDNPKRCETCVHNLKTLGELLQLVCTGRDLQIVCFAFTNCASAPMVISGQDTDFLDTVKPLMPKLHAQLSMALGMEIVGSAQAHSKPN